MTAEPYYYFLSYAREDTRHDHDGTIKTFHNDLAEAVRVRTNWSYERVGFLDASGLKPGAKWPDQLSAELASCRAFVPVLSPTYFDRPFCGQEWAAFAARTGALEAQERVRTRLIQPVQLVAPQHLNSAPAVVSAVQRTHDDYPRLYTDQGLRQVFRLHRADAYPQFVDAFAEALVAAVNESVLPASAVAPDIREIESAFQHPGTALTATLPEDTPTGPKFAQFFFVAGRRDEMKALRNDLRYYGDEGGLDWQPYLPDLSDEVAIIAQDVAVREKLRYESIPLDEHFVEAIEDAVKKNKIVAVLVDSWTVRLPAYRDLMKRLDGRDFDNCVVVIPWNMRDAETASGRDLLQQAIDATFVSTARRGDPQRFVTTTGSCTNLKDELSKSLLAARGRILESQAVVRKAESSGVFVDPALTAKPAAL